MSSDLVLELDGVVKQYGMLKAIDHVSLGLERAARHALIGPNGAGKTTLFHLIAGTLKPTAGRIVFAGSDVTRLGTHRRTRLGIGRTFQQSSLFDGLSATENVAIAVQRRLGYGNRLVRPVSGFRDVTERVDRLLEEVGLGQLGEVTAGALSHGHRRQLEVALALATEPKLLLLDEPTAGMSREEATQFLDLLSALPTSLTIVLVEHDMDVVFEFATHVSVLDAGHLIASGPPEEIRTSPVVQEAYLGPGERMEELFEAR